MAAERQPRAILTDIEGTTTPIAFVRDVLFPYACQRLPDYLASHSERPDVAALLAEVALLAPGQPAVAALLAWMAADAKITPLKTLQGLIWEDGYRTGALRGQIYPDVAPALRRWHTAGLRLYVYSSGSRAAQMLLFGHSTAGDLSGLFSGFFDTGVGPKGAADSYRAIGRAVGLPAADILFLSDVAAELDAAAESGMATCQLVRAADGTRPCDRHRTEADFAGVGLR